MADMIFEERRGRFCGTELARGPWGDRFAHGGATAALLAALIDAERTRVPMRTCRLTIDILRPVPLAPLTPRVSVVREGSNVQFLDAWLEGPDGTRMARASGVRVRVTSLSLPDSARSEVRQPPGVPEEGSHAFMPPGEEWGTGFWTAFDIRPMHGAALNTPGRSSAWFRLRAGIAPSLPRTGSARAAGTSDFGNGLGPAVSLHDWKYINPDLNLHLHRDPVGDWVALRSGSVAESTGMGLVNTTVFDVEGSIGTATQAVFVERQGVGGTQRSP